MWINCCFRSLSLEMPTSSGGVFCSSLVAFFGFSIRFIQLNQLFSRCKRDATHSSGIFRWLIVIQRPIMLDSNQLNSHSIFIRWTFIRLKSKNRRNLKTVTFFRRFFIYFEGKNGNVQCTFKSTSKSANLFWFPKAKFLLKKTLLKGSKKRRSLGKYHSENGFSAEKPRFAKKRTLDYIVTA